MINQKNPSFLPSDQQGDMIPLTTPTSALAVTYDTSISSATDITLNANTALIEVTAINNGVFLRYATGVTSSAFDEFILADSTRHFVVPAGVTTISVIEETASAKVVVIEK
jgi:hypothetical protein